MKKKLKNINICLSIYLNPAECEDLHKRMLATTCRSKSEFVRKVLFRKPVRVLTRDESIDDMIQELVSQRIALEKMLMMPLTEGERRHLSSTVETIKRKIDQLADYVCERRL